MKPRIRFALLWLLSSVLVLSICHRTAVAELQGVIPGQWRLVWTGDPASAATLSWSTREAGQTHAVSYCSEDGADKGTITCQRNGPYLGSGGRMHFHHAALRNLAPGTKYFVTLKSDQQRSREFWFVTAPRADKAISILFGGDSRSGIEARQKVNKLIAQLAQDKPSILAFAHGGDYIGSGKSFDQWSQWMTDHELTVTAQGRMLPIIPARGNHDHGELFNQVFNFKEGDTNYYAVDLGPQIRFLTLNTNISAGGDQRDWLKEQLPTARASYRWLVAQYHRPAYPAVKSPGSGKQHWVPLFEQHNVDLVCEADGHAIKRTVPIRNDKHDPTGVVYVGEGGLGVGQRSPKTDRWYLQAPGMAAKGHHVQLLNFSRDILQCQVVLLDGTVGDEFAREPHRKRLTAGTSATVP